MFKSILFGEMNKNKSFIFTILIAIIIISTFLIYGQVYYFKFINLDDLMYVEMADSNIKYYDRTTLEDISSSWKKFRHPYYMPFTHLSYKLDAFLYGVDNPGGFHVTNMFLHSLNSLLV
ncbi:uncharacterized protein METZ01_LOCUS422534, partial [marine metagenome]